MTIQYKVFESEVKAADDEALVIKHIISSETQDRGGDIMRVAGMRIVGKPVVLMLHGRGPMGSEPVGKPLSVGPDTWKGKPVIMAETQFYPDETGRRLYEKAKNGYLPNWSIGYSVEEAKDILKDGRYNGREVTKWTLLEWSPVGVPMQPDAQTIKEFLDADDAGSRPEIKEESHWFGVVDEKTCTNCGACPKEEEESAPAGDPPPGDDPLKALSDKITAMDSEAVKQREALVLAGEAIVAMGKKFEEYDVTLKSMKTTVDTATETLKKLETPPEALPPEPEGGKEGDEEHHDNPPEKKTPPRLVVVRDEETPEAEKQAARARILAIAREVINEAAKKEIDRMKGRVP